MAAEKQLIVVVEGTAALGPHWHSIVSDYLEKTIRSFCGMENGRMVPASTFELSLVTFNSHGSNCACLVQRSGWTRNVDVFMQWLSSIQFAGGGFNEAATAEGLAEALMMFSPPSGQAQPSNDFKRHCILVAASNPHTLPTPVYRPQVQNVERNENGEGQPESRLSDAETVAQYFSKRSVSLSVICPKQLPKIRAIYNVGRLSPQTADMPIDTVENHFYLVLISENFLEARAALSHTVTNLPQIQSSLIVDRTTIAPPPVTGQTPAIVASANGSISIRQSVSVGIVQNTTAKLEPGSVTSMAPLPSLPHIPSVAHSATQTILGVQSSSTFPVSQEMVSNAESLQDIKPVVGGMTESLCAGSSGGTNVNILNKNLMSGNGQANVSSGTGPTMHTPGIAHQVQSGTQPLNVNNSSASNIPQPSSGAVQNFQFKYIQVQQVDPSSVFFQNSECEYVKLWEGNLGGLRQGQPILITRLEAYRNAAASESLAADWPPTMQINRLISLSGIHNEQYFGKADFLVFRAMSRHGFLEQLREKNLCAAIQLPSQTLLLSVSNTVGRLTGLIVPNDVVVFKPQMPRQQHQQQQFDLQGEPRVVPLHRGGDEASGQVPGTRRSQGPPSNIPRPPGGFMG